MDSVSRAFINEDSEVLLNRESIVHEKKLRDWLAIQEKKLKFLETDPKAESMDQSLRREWIRQTRDDIEHTRKRLEDMASSSTEAGDAY
ncbi:MAG: hypothetical protein STSR0007_08880 [Thermovirga sp.]